VYASRCTAWALQVDRLRLVKSNNNSNYKKTHHDSTIVSIPPFIAFNTAVAREKESTTETALDGEEAFYAAAASRSEEAIYDTASVSAAIGNCKHSSRHGPHLR